jgi:Ca-activated chloride channel homolog
MSNEETPSPQPSPTDTELEARVVAWVLGETSPFEAAVLDRLTAEKPALAIFKRRIEAVHGLVGAAARPEKEPLRLSPERRAKLLRTLGAAEPPAQATTPSAPETGARVVAMSPAKPRKRTLLQRSLAIAAGLMVGLFTLNVVNNSLPFAGDREAVFSQEQPPPPGLSSGVIGSGDSVQKREATAPMLGVTSEEDGLPSQPLAAQSSSAPKITLDPYSRIAGATDDGAGILEPHVVTAEPMQSYMASNSTTGTRLNSTLDLGEVGKELRSHAAPRPAAAAPKDLKKKGPGLAEKNLSRGTKSATDAPAIHPEAPNVTFTTVGSAPPKNAGAGASGSTATSRHQLRDAATSKDNGDDRLVLSPFSVEAASRRRGTPVRNDAPREQESAPGTSAGFADAWSVTGGASADVVAPAESKREVAAASSAPSPFAETNATADRAEGYLAARERSEAIKQDNAPPSSAPIHKRPIGVPAAPPPATAPQKVSTPAVVPPAEAIDEAHAAKEPVSTFSLHVSDVAFKLAQAALARGEKPDASRIRPEEFYNAFDYGDPAPTLDEKIACRVEQAAHPFLQQRNLVRIAMKVPAAGRGAGQPLHLTVMLDTSGSMERDDRVASVRRAFSSLLSLLGPSDRITVVGFARQPRLLAEAVAGDQAGRLLDTLARTPAEGGTNLEEALNVSSTLARRHFNPAAQNRIVLLTDGAANLGNADPEQLSRAIETLRQQGIAFDACGVGTDGLDDAVLEALTRKGDGRYYVLDRAEEADTRFARQLAGAFRPAAENVKVQVRFNPARVGAYRLLGFEKHRLREEDFRNDQVDAAELAAEEAAVALYQVEVLPQGEGELGEVYVRFRDAATKQMVERSWTIAYDQQARAFDRATPSLQLAGTAAFLAEKLRGGALGDAVQLEELTPIANALRGHYAPQERVQQLVEMLAQLRRMEGR